MSFAESLESLQLNVKHLEDCFIGKYEQTTNTHTGPEGYILEIFSDRRFKYSYLHAPERLIYEGKWILQKNSVEPGQKTILHYVYTHCRLLLTADLQETQEKRETIEEKELGEPKKLNLLNMFGFCSIEDDLFGHQVVLHGRASWVAIYVDMIQVACPVTPSLLQTEILQLLEGVQTTFQAKSNLQNILARHGSKMQQGNFIDALNILLVLGGVWITACHPSNMNDPFQNYGEFILKLKQGIKDTLEKVFQMPDTRELKRQTKQYLSAWASVYADQVDESSEEAKKLNEALNNLLADDEGLDVPSLPISNSGKKRHLDSSGDGNPIPLKRHKNSDVSQEKEELSETPLMNLGYTVSQEVDEDENDSEQEAEEQPKLGPEEIAKLQYIVQQQKAYVENKMRQLQQQIENGEYPFPVKLPPRA
eukprot:TRINITY_DN13618_c0_g1_i1.p1 TRINITY_DN13618_c0_g1~~TRINITY_DN13618_c0_g1_i1.p1  ORF type:complete len:421 (-),score=75.43 TRINITY_DN13618_c0_g1_i1:46-1308(-)